MNLYRLIKAGLTLTEHNVFVRKDEKVLGDFEGVLFLLAVDTGLPRVSPAVFDVLLAANFDSASDDMDVRPFIESPNRPTQNAGAQPLPGPLKNFIEALDKHDADRRASDWVTLRAWMMGRPDTGQFSQEQFNRGIARLANWAPRVARYSFSQMLPSLRAFL